MTIKQFHETRQIRISYSETPTPIKSVKDFYNDFLISGKLLPDKSAVERWHDLLVRYINDADTKTFIVRKYSGGRENDVWNNRRGAVIRFSDGFEIVYADNFLAHEIYLMAWHGFVPDYDDFKRCIEKREMPITSGTSVEKLLRLYSAATSNKKCGCYLAHIVDVNGAYLRSDSDYRKISSEESSRLYPLGTPDDWTMSLDRIYHPAYNLTAEEKALVKAHFLRFLDPLNHYVTPETKHCVHTLANWSPRTNIGEYPNLTYYVQTQYQSFFASRYDQFIENARTRPTSPAGYTGTESINLEVTFSKSTSTAISSCGVSGTLSSAPKNASKAGTSKKTQYKFAGAVYNQRQLLLNLVKQYCTDNPSATYDDLTRVFNLRLIFDKKTIIRLPADLSSKDISVPRVFKNDPIMLHDGVVVVVNNQVQKDDMPAIICIAKDLGYTISPM